MTKRFQANDTTVYDHQTGLMWTRDAAINELPMTWQEALDFLSEMNAAGLSGYHDWHLPNRRALFSLIDHSRIHPAIAGSDIFRNIFHGYYWTSTSCARLPAQAWYVHLGGAKVYRGMKYTSYMVWPVRVGREPVTVLKTGQSRCYDADGQNIPCNKTYQDGALRIGRSWPEPRFTAGNRTVYDQLTGLTWPRLAARGENRFTWHEALEQIETMKRGHAYGHNDWRMPHIRELESLVDLGEYTPALPAGHPFVKVQHFYWSSTTSLYETRYAWTLYMQDGAVGVGYKANAEFYLWPVRG